MSKKHPFEEFLAGFIPRIEAKSNQFNKALWLLETTGSRDAADLKAALDTELKICFSDSTAYQKLLQWDADPELNDPLLKRQLNVLIRAFKQNQLPSELLADIAKKEADLLCSYANFRPERKGKTFSENEIREVLKKAHDVAGRKEAWEASKDIGVVLAPQILALVNLRNQAAVHLGFTDYFQMQLELQEVEESWLFHTLESLAVQTNSAYNSVIDAIEDYQCRRFAVSREDLGPWAWSEPFGQEDPIDTAELDALAADVDICSFSIKFYHEMGLDVQKVFENSDMFERAGKNQHAFCINMDRHSDVRTLNNVRPTIKWLETVLHEFGHAVYELGYDKNLPWLLREPPHMLSTEAMALLAGRQAYAPSLLCRISDRKNLIKKAGESLKRRQLIFSRWVLVMTFFERELYRDPSQDLNSLWWKLVAHYQKVLAPEKREGGCDWAAKYHIGLAPVYYYSYLLGEMLASAIEEALLKATGSKDLANPKAGSFLKHKLFSPGNRMLWSALADHVLEEPLTPNAWIRQFITH